MVLFGVGFEITFLRCKLCVKFLPSSSGIGMRSPLSLFGLNIVTFSILDGDLSDVFFISSFPKRPNGILFPSTIFVTGRDATISNGQPSFAECSASSSTVSWFPNSTFFKGTSAFNSENCGSEKIISQSMLLLSLPV